VIEEDLGLGTAGDLKYMGGSSWSSCYTCETDNEGKLFVKTALGRSAKDMFEGEALGLRAMYGMPRASYPEELTMMSINQLAICSTSAGANALKIPKVYSYGDGASGRTLCIRLTM